MMVAYWLLGIAASILVVWLLGAVSEKHRKNIVLAVAAGWTAWTLWVLFLPALILIQLSVIWGSVLLLFKISGQRARIRQLETHVQDSNLRDRLRQECKVERPLAISGKAHGVYLQKALRECEDTLCILSGWATDFVIDRRFKVLIRDALPRGVSIYIGFGWKSSSNPQPKRPTDIRARRTLSEADEWARAQHLKGSLTVAEFPTHQKLLICDDKFIACGSHNWLSNAGYRNAERSLVFSNRDFVASERERAIEEIRSHSTARP